MTDQQPLAQKPKPEEKPAVPAFVQMGISPITQQGLTAYNKSDRPPATAPDFRKKGETAQTQEVQAAAGNSFIAAGSVAVSFMPVVGGIQLYNEGWESAAAKGKFSAGDIFRIVGGAATSLLTCLRRASRAPPARACTRRAW